MHYIRNGRWDRLGPATAISVPIIFAISSGAGLLDLLVAW